jgi:hypothetical protein
MAPGLKELLQEECPVCTEYMLPPISMCVNGHSTCSTCKGKLLTCLLCRCPFSRTRCLLAENLVRKMRFPCRHSKRGCRKTFYPQGARTHEEECSHRPIKCPFSSIASVKCPWEDNVSKVKNHIRKIHYVPTDNTREKTTLSGVINCYDPNSCNFHKAIFVLGETFFMTTRIKQNNVYLCLCHAGLQNISSYKYAVAIRKRDGRGIFSVCNNTTNSFQDDVKKIFEVKDCTVFTQKQWEKCTDKEHWFYKVIISKN